MALGPTRWCLRRSGGSRVRCCWAPRWGPPARRSAAGRQRQGARSPSWTAVFAAVAAAATLLQLLVGGVVTGNAAGLAVVDWPNSFGYNMFLYPLSRMTGGVYYEHAHRLFGTLVGLTTLVLAVHLLRVERRPLVRRLALLAVLVVIVQGILGGLRVTGTFTLSSSPAAMTPSITLAIVHGVLGPAFFGLMVALAVFTSPTWTGGRAPTNSSHVPADRILGVMLVGIVLVQLLLGAIQRHLSRGLLVHITFAVVVLAMTLLNGSRLWGLYRAQPLLERLGKALIIVGCVQFVLGFLAFFAVEARVEGAPRAVWEVLLTTAHQAGGSVLLGCAVMAALWTRRLLAPGGAHPPGRIGMVIAETFSSIQGEGMLAGVPRSSSVPRGATFAAPGAIRPTRPGDPRGDAGRFARWWRRRPSPASDMS